MELWDLYDKNREKLGRTMARGTPIPEGTYRLVVHVCIFNRRGEMLIQKRQADREIFPGMWDISLGGSALAGEDSAAAAMRECREELGLAVDLTDTRPHLTVHFTGGFDDVYVVEQDVPLSALSLQKEEVAEVMWAGEDAIRRMIGEGSFIPYHLPYLSLLFLYRTHRGNLHRKSEEKA